MRRYVAEVRRRQPAVLVEVKVPQTHPPGAEAEVDFGQVELLPGRGAGGWLDVRVPPVGVGPRLPPGLSEPGPAGVPRRPRPRLRALRRGAGPDPLRQLEAGGGAGAEGPGPGRVGTVHRPAVALRVRLVLLSARHRGRPREGRRRGRGRPVPAPPPRPGPARRTRWPSSTSSSPRRRRRRSTSASPGGRSPSASTSRSRRNTLQPLPVERFDTTLLLTPRVDAKSRVCVRQCFYSVPVRFVGRRVEVRLGAETIEVLDGSPRRRDPCPARRQGRRVAGARPLPGGAADQARRPARRHRPGPGPSLRGVQRRPRALLDGGPTPSR